MIKIVPCQTLLIKEVSLSVVLQIYQGHVTVPPPTAYHGVVADQFMAEWKRAESEDLIAERTRLKHGELSHQEGTDDQVFQFLLMQAQQVSSIGGFNLGCHGKQSSFIFFVGTQKLIQSYLHNLFLIKYHQ